MEVPGTKRLLPEPWLTYKNVRIPALIDTGSEVTCISAATWQTMQQVDPKLPSLPLIAIQVQGAFNTRSKRITRQSCIAFEIKGQPYYFCCLIDQQWRRNYKRWRKWALSPVLRPHIPAL